MGPSPDQSSRSVSSGLVVPLLYGGAIAVAAVTVYLLVQVDRMRTELAAIRDSVEGQVSKVQEASSVLNSANQRNLDALREELENARRTATVAAGEAKSEALRHAEELAKELQAEQRKQRQQVSSEITEVKQAETLPTPRSPMSRLKSALSGARSLPPSPNWTRQLRS